MITYAVVVAMTVYTIMGLENPRSGFIRLGEPETVVTESQAFIR